MNNRLKNFLKINYILIILLLVLVALTLYFLIKNDPVFLSAIGTIMIAVATITYTYYSWKTLSELRKQNDYLVEKERNEYIFKRKSITKKLLRELHYNQIVLNNLKNMILKLITIDDVERTKHIIKINNLLEWVEDLEINTYNDFIQREIEFKNDNLTESLETIYKRINNLKRNLYTWFKYIDEFGLKVFNELVRSNIGIINKIIKDIDEIYPKFSNEINYDFKKSIYFSDYKILEKEIYIKESNES